MKEIRRIFPWIFLVCSFGVLCAFMILRFEYVLDSDMASELILAQQMSQEGRFMFTDSWYYPSELRVLSFQLIMAPLFRIFSDWHMLRVTGSVICYLLLLLSYFYFCCQAGLRKEFPLTAAFLLMPFSVEYFAVCLYGLFYLPHMIVAFFMIGMVLKLRKTQKTGTIIRLVSFLTILSFLGGMGGQRLPAILAAPLFGASVLLLMLHRKMEKRSWDEINSDGELRVFAASTLILVSMGAGLLVNQIVLAKIFSFRSYQFVRLGLPSIRRIGKVLLGWLNSLGLWTRHSIDVNDWPTSGMVEPFRVPLEILICTVLCLILLAAFVWCVKYCGKIRYEAKFIIAFLFVGGVTLTGLYMVTTMEFAVRYLLPITVFAIPVIALYLKEAELPVSLKRFISGGTVVLVTLGCLSTYQNFWSVDLTEDAREIAHAAESQGYHEGYATFWNGNLLTELTDGNIEMWVWPDWGYENGIEDIDDVFVWLQLARHSTEHPQGKVFVLLSSKENETYTIAEKMRKEQIIYESDSYVMYGYDSYDELQKDLNQGG